MNKVIFITGATKNSGLAIAKKFASAGYAVAISSRRGADAEIAAAALTKEYGVSCKGYEMSMVDPAEIRAVFVKVKEDFGRLDIFVANSANLGIGQDFLTLTEEGFDSVIDTNIKGNFFCCQAAAGIMKENGGGRIILIGSVHYKGAVWGRCLYAASKGAIASLVRNMAFELAQYGIRVNQLVAGAIRTDRWDGVAPEEEARRRRNWPTGMEATGEEIAEGVFYLASEAAKNITGAELTIDSGISACLLPYNGGEH